MIPARWLRGSAGCSCRTVSLGMRKFMASPSVRCSAGPKQSMAGGTPWTGLGQVEPGQSTTAKFQAEISVAISLRSSLDIRITVMVSLSVVVAARMADAIVPTASRMADTFISR